MLRFEGGLIGHVHAPDNPAGPAEVTIQGTLGRARVAGDVAEIAWWNGQSERLPPPNRSTTSMDVAMQEIVAWLDDHTPVCCSAEDSVRTLEVILACHASHARQAAWIELPLTDADREREVQSG